MSFLSKMWGKKEKPEEKPVTKKDRSLEVHVIFDAPPSNLSIPMFQHFEDGNGKKSPEGIQWVERPDGLWALGPFLRKEAK